MTSFIQGSRVLYWKGSVETRNFGDYITKLLLDRALLEPRLRASRYRLIGSIIDDRNVEADLSAVDDGGKIAFWGCGARDTQCLRPDLLERCAFFGVRGPLTRDVIGLPAETTLGDTGLLTPLLHPPAPNDRRHGRTICVPHFYEPRSDEELLELTGAEAVVRPTIAPSLDALEALLEQISGAAFVLAGALHAAITAHAYGIPFAFFDSGHLDAPFKWRDFATSINISAVFVDNVEDGRVVHDKVIRKRARKLPLLPILENAPYHVRPSMLLAAAEHDGLACVPPVLVDALRRSPIESAGRLRAARDSECERDDRLRGYVSRLEDLLRTQAHDAVASARGERDGNAARLESELACLRAELATSAQEGRQATQAYADLMSRHDTVCAELAAATAAGAATAVALDQAQADASKRLSDFMEAARRNDELEAEVAAQRTRSAADIRRLEAEAVDLHALLDRKHLESRRAVLEGARSLREAEAAAGEARKAAVSLNGALGVAIGDLARLERERWEAQREAAANGARRDEALGAVARLEVDLSRAAQAHADLLARHEAVCEDLDRLEGERRRALSETAAAAEHRDAAIGEVSRLEEELNRAIEAHGDLLSHHEGVRADLSRLEHERAQAVREAEANAAQREEAREAAARLEHDLHRAAQAQADLVSRCAGLAAQIDVFRGEQRELRFDARLAEAARRPSGSARGGLAGPIDGIAARLAVRRRDWRVSERRHGRILLREPDRSRVLVQFGHALKEQGERDLAAAAYARAIRLDPADHDAANHLFHVLRALGRDAEAAALDARFRPYDVFAPPPREASKAAAARPPSLWRRLQQADAVRAAKAGDWPRAITRLEALVRVAPGHAWQWLRLGEARAATDDPRRAWFAYAEAVRRDPRSPDGYRGLQPVLDRAGRRDLADLARVRAFQLAPGDPAAREALRSQGWSDKALVDLVLTAEARPIAAPNLPLAAVPRLWAARWAARRKDWTAAARRYGRIAASQPGYWRVWVQLGHALKESGEVSAAEGAYLQALALAREDADVHLQLGHAIKLLGRPTEARDAYARACALDPAMDHARREWAWMDARCREAAAREAHAWTAHVQAPPPEDRALPEPASAFDPVDAGVVPPDAPPVFLTTREARFWLDLRRVVGAAAGA
jgi:tetratricopeptide (TPR) repeat protein